MQRILSLSKTMVAGLLVAYLVFANFSVVASATEETETRSNGSSNQTTDSRAAEQATPSESTVAVVEIQDYTVGSGTIDAGENAEILLNLRNASSTSRATAVMITISSNSGMIFPSFGQDNQIYVGAIAPGETKQVSVPVTVSPSFSGDYIDLNFRFDYASNGKAYNNSATVILPAASGAELYVRSVGLGSNAVVNSNSLLSINYSNKSKQNIEDAELVINGNVSEESSHIKLGSVYAGKSYTKDYHITFTEVGQQDINIQLTYTGTSGEAVTTDLGNYTIDVSQESVTEQNSKRVGAAAIWGGRLVAALASIAVIIAGVVYIKRR